MCSVQKSPSMCNFYRRIEPRNLKQYVEHIQGVNLMISRVGDTSKFTIKFIINFNLFSTIMNICIKLGSPWSFSLRISRGTKKLIRPYFFLLLTSFLDSLLYFLFNIFQMMIYDNKTMKR